MKPKWLINLEKLILGGGGSGAGSKGSPGNYSASLNKSSASTPGSASAGWSFYPGMGPWSLQQPTPNPKAPFKETGKRTNAPAMPSSYNPRGMAGEWQGPPDPTMEVPFPTDDILYQEELAQGSPSMPDSSMLSGAGDNYFKYLKGAGDFSSTFRNALMEKLNYNQDLIKDKAQAEAAYLNSPAQLREKYKDIWDPEQREALVAKERQQLYSDYAMMQDVLEQRLGELDDIMGVANEAYQGELQFAKAQYDDAYRQYKDERDFNYAKYRDERDFAEDARKWTELTAAQRAQINLESQKMQADSYGGSTAPVKFEGVDDIVSVNTSYGAVTINKAYASSLQKMIDAARADGINLHLISGYRSIEEQQAIWDKGKWVTKNGKKQRVTQDGRPIAKPGGSYHQWGGAFDANTKNAKSYNWLKANAKKFGFSRQNNDPNHFYIGSKMTISQPAQKELTQSQRKTMVHAEALTDFDTLKSGGASEEEAYAALVAAKTSVVTELGASGYNLLIDYINELYPFSFAKKPPKIKEK